MSSVVTSKVINLPQLASETEAALQMWAVEGGQMVVAVALDEATLQAAVDNHVAVDGVGNRTTIETQAIAAHTANKDDITTNDTFLAISGNPTNAQILAQVKELTRQSSRQARELNGLIRLVLNRFDATD